MRDWRPCAAAVVVLLGCESKPAARPTNAETSNAGGERAAATASAERPPAPQREGMALVPAGEFWMGCEPRDEQCTRPEKPRHRVHLDAFHMDKTEVTVAQYRDCVNAGQCTTEIVDAVRKGQALAKSTVPLHCNWAKAERDNHPINCVVWSDADAFCRWAGKRLPTEAEWERTARGSDGRIYPWGNEPPSCERAIMSAGEGPDSHGCGRNSTWPVGSKPAGASPYDVMDMAGNVSEFVADWHGTYPSAAQRNPKGPTEGSERVTRGGSWVTGGILFRASYRHYQKPHDSGSILGFRCAKSAK